MGRPSLLQGAARSKYLALDGMNIKCADTSEIAISAASQPNRVRREPVRLVAVFLEDAVRIYEDWVDKYHADHSEEPGIIHRFTIERLRARPHLSALAARSKAGIAYWSRTACKWTVGRDQGATLF